jgi:hypothetical protein
VWNLYYYPHLDQWWSFAGGLVIVAANVLWIGLMVYYLWRERTGYAWYPIIGGTGFWWRS